MPVYVVERVSWERRFGRTVGWTFAVARPGARERAFFHAGALGCELTDLGVVGRSAGVEPLADKTRRLRLLLHGS